MDNILLQNYNEIPNNQLKQIIYPTGKIETPFGKKKVLYADFTASGRPSPIIEKYITKNIYTKYSNTHSNASNGICMKNEIENVKNIIKQEYNLDDTYEILFKGSGVTGAINYLISCMDFSKYKRVSIFISTYEHYSNHLPWIELAKHNKNVEIFVIPLTKMNCLDTKWYETALLRAVAAEPRSLIITSIIHCSNLTGYFTPLREIKRIIARARRSAAAAPHTEMYFMTDAACSAPYVDIDGSIFDAFFISPHKFIGGMETPGILIAKTALFQKNYSANPGGSCIKKTRYNLIEYADDIEVRENAGTPNIVGIIKIGQCLLLKRAFQHIITNNEHVLHKITKKWTEYFTRKYPDKFFAIQYCQRSVSGMPIFSFHLKNLHYNFVVVLLNDLYGIQSRGGISCDGLFNDFVKDKYSVSGFCRISLHWTMTRQNIRDIFSAVEFVIEHGNEYLSKYEYDAAKNLWISK